MKAVILILFMNFYFVSMSLAQVQKEDQGRVQAYKAFIYTSDDLETLIQRSRNKDEESRSLLGTGVNALAGLGLGYFTSAIDFGINAIGASIVQNSINRKKWEEIITAENKNSISIGTINKVNDFYSENSLNGVFDPKGMIFNGIGCLRTEGKDTVFYLSCHINKNKIDQIVKYSKFELILDTLIIVPKYSNVPNNSIYTSKFSFKDRGFLQVGMNIKIVSSWMTYFAMLQNNQQLGEFNFKLRISEEDLDSEGVLRYVRKEDEPAKYEISGESFIVPRSYSSYQDEFGKYKDVWGTGEYQVNITLNEECGTSKEFEKKWKQNWKWRKKIEREHEKKGTLIDQAWQFIRRQEWDALAKQWVITTLKAPANEITQDIIKKSGLPASVTKTASSASVAGNNSLNNKPDIKLTK